LPFAQLIIAKEKDSDIISREATEGFS
jgi:hypothetical protein